MGVDFTPDDAIAGAGGASGPSSGKLDLYGLGDVGAGPVYYRQTTYLPASGPVIRGHPQPNSTITSGAETLSETGTKAAADFAAASQSDPANFQALQQALYAGDYYSGKPRLGVYTSADASALKKALTDYQRINGTTGQAAFSDWLRQRAGQVKKTGGIGGGPTRAPLTISYTDPAELETAVQSAAQQSLGRNLSQNEIHSFVGAFHSKEASAQRGAYNSDSSVTNPEMTGEATNFVTKGNQEEANNRHEATLIDSIGQMLGVL